MIAAGIDIVRRTDWTAMAARERLDTMDTLETDQRLTLAISTAIAATIADEPIATLGDVPKKLIADTLRITPAEAATRLTQAALVRERSTLTGEPLAPHLPATAAAWNRGLLDAAHLAEIITFFDRDPRRDSARRARDLREVPGRQGHPTTPRPTQEGRQEARADDQPGRKRSASRTASARADSTGRPNAPTG